MIRIINEPLDIQTLNLNFSFSLDEMKGILLWKGVRDIEKEGDKDPFHFT